MSEPQKTTHAETVQVERKEAEVIIREGERLDLEEGIEAAFLGSDDPNVVGISVRVITTLPSPRSDYHVCE